MYNEYENGGLNMIDITALQKSFLLCWANRLLDENEEKWKEPVKKIFQKVGGLKVFECNTCSKSFRGVNKITSNFWKNVLLEWLDRKPACLKRNINLTDPIFNNSNNTLKEKTLFFRKDDI